MSDEIEMMRARLRECERERDEARASDAESIAMYHRARDGRDAARAEVARLTDGIKAIRADVLAECNKLIRPTLDDVIGAVIERCDDLLPGGGA